MSNEIFYVTGGAGFIGRHFNNLIDEKRVKNIDLRDQKVVPNQVKGDVRKIQDIRDSIGESNIIVHLAASHYDFEKDYFETNVGGTKNLLKVATEKNIDRFIYFSSVAVYGQSEEVADEDTNPIPDNDYGRSKVEAENLILEWAQQKPERKVLFIRPAVVFGPHNYGNLFNLTRNIDRGINFHIGKKPVIKSLAYVENLVEATYFLIQNMKEKSQVYNYVDKPQLTNVEISNTISKAFGQRKSITIFYPLALLLGYTFDLIGKFIDKEMMISVKRVKKFCTPTHFKAEKVFETGFTPRYNTESALTHTTKWFDENREEWGKEHEMLKKLFQKNYGITIE
ncbi:MAG: NAD-dependent epimerase/dehydratase family protein [Candidatus Paceibacterota bacterium]